MASIIKANNIQRATGTDITVGVSGDTVTIPTGAGLTVTDEVKTNKISPATGVAFELGDSGDTFTVPSGATIVNSGTATGFGGGKVLQLVSTTKTDVWTAATGWNDITGMSIAITPAADSSTILLLVHANICNVTSVTNGCMVRLVRDSTSIAVGTGTLSNRIAASFEYNGNGTSRTSTSGAIVHLDSPATTSATTYKLQGYTPSGTFGLNRINPDNDDAYTSRTASSITAIEIGA